MDAAAYGTHRPFRSASAFSTSTRYYLDADILKRLRNRTGLIGWWCELWTVRYREKSRRIDLLARVLFPLFFVLFNIIYWICYLRPYLAEEMEENFAKGKANEGTTN
ncbi:hypothetical protein niasHS_014735 [Heterodera schachtii]|uniref:Uncharacterized protein n=2 Tax=Heterodera TaxID=34509 RepID=A0ABD2IRY1_HETSC